MESKFLITTLLCLNSSRVRLIPLKSHSIYLQKFKRIVIDENPTSFIYCSQCKNILKFHHRSWSTLIRHFNNHSHGPEKSQKSGTKCSNNTLDSKAYDFKVMKLRQQSNRKFKLEDPLHSHLPDNSHPVEKIIKRIMFVERSYILSSG